MRQHYESVFCDTCGELATDDFFSVDYDTEHSSGEKDFCTIDCLIEHQKDFWLLHIGREHVTYKIYAQPSRTYEQVQAAPK